MDLVCGTTTSQVGYSGQFPLIDIQARDGVYATKALFDAEERPDDTVSSPMPEDANEAAVDTADPLDEPEAKAAAKNRGLYGLSARP